MNDMLKAVSAHWPELFHSFTHLRETFPSGDLVEAIHNRDEFGNHETRKVERI
jgi:hypothetical protein